MAKKKAAPPPATSADAGGELAYDRARVIAHLLDECRVSQAVHNRKLKELSSILSSTPSPFLPSFLRALTPLFHVSHRTASSERVVRFVSAFAASVTDPDFFERFLRFLLVGSHASHRFARFRSCQIISEIIMRLPDDADVSGDVWDEVIECMKHRATDKVPMIRAFAVRALSRFSNDPENTDIADFFLEMLPEEPNIEVRKTIVLSLPPSSTTSVSVIARTLDVSESVRKAAYCALAARFPLQSLSIKQRSTVLERGLTERSSVVRKECLRMLKEDWLPKCCDGDVITLLRFLDVETYETVAEAVMKALLEDGAVQLKEGQSIRQMIVATPGQKSSNFRLMEPEFALFWKMMCMHLQTIAQSKGSDAATTMGAEAAVYASQASINNDLLEEVLPATVSDYVDFVKAHLSAGPTHRFVTRQLLLLGAMLDFSDLTNKKVAAALVHELLHCSPEHEVDDEGNEIIIGDGVSLGGDRDWAKAVSGLAKKVHASFGEFEEMVTVVIEELARPCRERCANPLQWMHCLAVTGLLLENIESFRCLQGKAMEPTELLHSLLLSGAKHIHFEVQRVATRCLCLFGLLERKPSETLVKQLRLSVIDGPPSVSTMACKALIDLATWHGAVELDKAIKVDNSQHGDPASFVAVDLDVNEDANVGLFDLLFSRFESATIQGTESDDQEVIQGVLGEGFAKLLLLSNNNASISPSLHPLILAKLITLYFTSELKELDRLKQCLAVFFEHYPALSNIHKMCLSKTFIPVMRAMWPSIYGNAGGSSYQISKMRKRAAQAAQFMLQMMQTPIIPMESQEVRSNHHETGSLSCAEQPSSDVDSGEEGLAIRIAAEVISCPEKKNAPGRSYISALCKIIVLVNFRPSKQTAIKCMRGLLNCIIESALADKDSAKELTWMASRLKSVDDSLDKEPSKGNIREIFEKLEIGLDCENLNASLFVTTSTPAPTPSAPRSTRVTATKRRARREVSSSEDEDSPMDGVAVPAVTPAIRSERASKTAAMSRMTMKAAALLSDLEDECSDVTSEGDSGGSTDESEG